MAVDAVWSEPFSDLISLLTGNFTGNLEIFGPVLYVGPARMLHIWLCLARRGGPSGRKKNREFS